MTATINQPVLDTILAHLALLFLTATAGDPAAAKDAAARALAAYNAQTEEELRLAAEVISFGFHALEALAQADAPDLSPNRTLRLRGSAVSLSRQAHKAQGKLDQLQRARRTEAPAQSETAPAPEPSEDVAQAYAEAERLAKQIIAKNGKNGGIKWTQAYQKRQLAARMAEKVKKNQAQYAAQTNGAAPQTPAAPLSH